MKLNFDAYDWRARVAPAFLVSLPVIVTLTTCFKWDVPIVGQVLEGGVWILLIYALTIPIREAGNSIEPELWKNWGGPPSTTIMRWKDNRIGKDLKKQYHDAVRNYLNLPMPSEEDEIANPGFSDALISQAFIDVRRTLREKDPAGLWFIENANYGFYRNLLGSRKLWIILSIGGIVINGIFSIATQERIIIGGFAGNVCILALAIYLGWHALPNGIEHVAFRYAENAWASFLNIAKRMRKPA